MYSFIKVLQLKIKKVKLSWRQKIDSTVKIYIQKKGKLALGKFTHILRYSTIHADGGNIIIGNGCFFNEGIKIVSHEKIEIGNNCAIGPNVCIYDHDHNYIEKKGFICSPVSIGENVWIGAGAIILRGTSIGDNCVIGAGTIVKGIIPSNCIVTNKKDMEIRNINKG